MLPRLDGAEHLLTELRAALVGHFARVEKESVEDLCVSNIIRRPYSTVLFLTVKTDRHTRKLVAKRIVHHPENKTVSTRENQAVVEFNILQHLYAKFEPVAGCSVCRPVVVLSALETVVIEFVEGTLLADELGRARYLSSRSGFAQLQALFHQCGRWLSHFQEFTKAQPTGPEIVDGILQRCDFRLGLIEAAHDPRCPDHLRSRVMRRLHQQRRSLEGACIRAAGRHGDFGPWNILCGPAGITVLDFFSYQEEPLPVDPLQMLMALEREKACLTTNALRIEALKECFVEGYGNLSGVQAPLVYLCESLQRICTVQGCVTPRGGWFHKRIERSRCVRSNLEWLTADTPPSSLWPRAQQRFFAASVAP
jgi:hypothetical protein